jgi:hypothetical protein
MTVTLLVHVNQKVSLSFQCNFRLTTLGRHAVIAKLQKEHDASLLYDYTIGRTLFHVGL